MVKDTQLVLAFIDRSLDDNHIQQRLLDGYVNATALCQACGKKFNDYCRISPTKAFLEKLSSETGLPASALIQTVKGGDPQLQGTWVHPMVAINLGQWSSPDFAVAVTKWVMEWLTGSIKPTKNMPYHLQRYILNRDKIPTTHFSIFNEIVYSLIAPLEDEGYTLPDNLVPDISEGRIFARWVREEMGLEPNDFPTYTHTYSDGRNIPNVKLYPNELLPAFREHFTTEWILKRAGKYFKDRDPKALPYLEKVTLKLQGLDQKALLESKRKEEEKNDTPFNNSIRKVLRYNPREEDGD